MRVLFTHLIPVVMDKEIPASLVMIFRTFFIFSFFDFFDQNMNDKLLILKTILEILEEKDQKSTHLSSKVENFK